MPIDRQLHRRLRDVLTSLYLRPADATRIARDAGVSLGAITLSGSAANIWDSILEEADKADQLLAVVQAAMREYASNRPLAELSAELLLRSREAAGAANDRAEQLRKTATFGVITALPEEYAAVEAMLDDTVPWTAPGQGAGRRYLLGRVPSADGREHVVALGLLPDMGTNNASIRATQLLEHFAPVTHIIMCGIAGGIPVFSKAEDHVRLGDVVISDRNGVVQYDFIKMTVDEIVHRHPPRPPGAELLEAVRLLRATELKGQNPWEAFFDRARGIKNAARPADNIDAEGNPIEHPADPERREGMPRIIHGPIASANILLKDPAYRDALRAQFGVRAVEMETSGIADAGWISDRAGYLAVRGVCDYCNDKKGDRWHGYAAVAAATYFRALLESMPSRM